MAELFGRSPSAAARPLNETGCSDCDRTSSTATARGRSDCRGRAQAGPLGVWERSAPNPMRQPIAAGGSCDANDVAS